MSPKEEIAFFGATGGCAGACLARCLQAGYKCTALVRNPEKLTTLLATYNISSELVASHLTIISGNVTNPEDVSRTILPTTEIIVSGIGASPVWKPGHLLPDMGLWRTICQEGIDTIKEVLQSRKGVKPLLVAISTTGLSDFGRDIPLLMVPFYYFLLSIPHKDKKAMEQKIIAGVVGEDAPFGEFAIVRASLLTNGECGKIRAEVEDGKVISSAAIGYTISRKDVGRYIFEEIIERYTEAAKGTGRIISITH